jgi:hypothetical protein
MKLIILIFSLVISNSFLGQDKEIIGKWKPKAAQNEDKFECSAEIKSSFWINFISDTNYQMLQKYGTDAPPIESEGTYKVNKNNLTLTYQIGKLSTSLDIPVIELTEDHIILDYNLCPLRDIISNARLELERVK